MKLKKTEALCPLATAMTSRANHSKSSVRKHMRVQVPPSALKKRFI